MRRWAALVTLSLPFFCNALPAAAAAAAYVPALHDGDTFPDVALVDQRGRPVAFSDFHGSALVLAFFYARCPDRVCSLVGAKFAKLARLPASEHVHLMEVTLDPKHDTTRVLADYGATFGADPHRFTLATGTAVAIDEVMARANVASARTANGFAHSTGIIVLDGHGRIFGTLEDTATANDVRAEARAALGPSPNAGASILRRLSGGIANVCGGRSGIPAAAVLAIFAALILAGALLVRKLFATGATGR